MSELVNVGAQVLEDLSEEECYLLAILLDQSGLDLAELTWHEPDSPDGCFRAWPFQWRWWRDQSPLQVDQCARSVGKTLSITVRMFAFPFIHPGQEAVITAPELVHLEPLTNLIERRLYETRLSREMMPRGRGAVTHRPFMCIGEGQLVLTARGHVPIEQVREGDLVLTHRNRWRPVTYVWDRGVRGVVGLGGTGHTKPLVLTPDHRLWGRRSKQKETYKSGRRAMERVAQPPEWLAVGDWKVKDPATRWASPADIPPLPVPADFRLNKQGYGVGNGALMRVLTPEFLWLVGLYLAEGCTWRQKLTVLSIHADEVGHVGERLSDLGIPFHVTVGTGEGRDIRVSNRALASWFSENIPGDCYSKQVPVWVYGLSKELRRALLEGYLYGDGTWTVLGHNDAETASKALAYSMRLLANTLGVQCGVTWKPERRGRPISSGPMWALHFNFDDLDDVAHVHCRWDDGHVWTAATRLTDEGTAHVYDLEVDEDHSFVVEGVVVHNCNFVNGSRIIGRIPQRDGRGVKGIHPIWLELDEAQDYSPDGWTELIETLKRGHEGAVWRVHGVTRGIRDKFYEITQDGPENQWSIHRLTAIHRPNWSDQERQEKIKMYTSRDHPDYRRNVLGLHGDAQNPLFVLHRLMMCVDDDLESSYNTNEYQHYRVTNEMLTDRGLNRDITEFLDFPAVHQQYKNTWIGMDVGVTNHPSEIVVAAAEKAVNNPGTRTKGDEDDTRLRVIARIHLERISNPMQCTAITHIMDFYRPQVFAMDKTGLGLPLFQDLQAYNPRVAEQIKGYGFAEKILVDFDEQVLANLGPPELWSSPDLDVKEAGIFKNVLEFATDTLRDLVDRRRWWMPWDTDMVGQFSGQTWSWSKEAMDAYGRRRRVYSQGSFHALDACRMLALGYVQNKIEKMMAQRKVRDDRPVFDSFVML